MPRIWRISNYADLEGRGGLRAGQRWHTRGRRVVYCAPSPAAAILETLAHFEIDSIADLPSSYQLLSIEFPDSVRRTCVELKGLPRDWLDARQLATTREIGDRWLAEARYPGLEVPSALAPETWNVLLNPLLLEGTGIRIAGIARYPFDPRLFKVVGG